MEELIGLMNMKIEICIVVLLLALAPKAAQRFNQGCFFFHSSVVYKAYFRYISTGVIVVAIVIIPNYCLNRVRLRFVNIKILNIDKNEEGFLKGNGKSSTETALSIIILRHFNFAIPKKRENLVPQKLSDVKICMREN